MFEILSNYGITPSVLQIAIVVVAAAVVIGFFWQYIAIGCGLLLCFYVFAMPGKVDVSSKHELTIERSLPPPIVEVPKVVETPKVIEPVVVENAVPPEYIQDCMRLLSKNKKQCETMWYENDTVQSKEQDPMKETRYVKEIKVKL